MSIEITCNHCETTCEAPDDSAGMVLTCPACGADLQVPPSGIGSRWYFRMPGGQQFGPVAKGELDNYLFEGVITADCHLLEEGSGRWLWAAEVYAEVPDTQSYASRNSREMSTLRGGLAVAGLIDRVPCIRDRLPGPFASAHWDVHEMLERECAASAEGIRFLGSKSLGILQGVTFGRQFAENFKAVLPPRANVLTNSLVFGACAIGSLDLYLVVPFTHLEMLPHELFAILPGTLSASFGLRPGGIWVGAERSANDLTAVAARTRGVKVCEETVWKWASKERKTKGQLEWGMQVVPIGSEQFAVNTQSAKGKSNKRPFGIDAFFRDLTTISRFVARLEVPGISEARFPFHSESSELLARMFGG